MAAAEPPRWHREEHRAHFRVHVALPATCVPIHPDGTRGAKFSATTVDLSAGGVALRMPRGVLPPLDLSAGGVGQRVPRRSLIVHHLASNEPPLNVHLVGIIARLAIVDDSVVLGVRFAHLNPATRRQLTTFVFSEAARTGAYTSPSRTARS